MTQYDGEIRIKAKLETKEFDEEVSKLPDKIEEQTLKLNKQNIKVKELEEQYKSFIKNISKTPEEIGLEKSLKRAEKELNKLEDSYVYAQGYLDIQKVAGGIIPPEIQNTIKKYEKLLETVRKLKEQLKQVRLDPSSTPSVKKLSAELEIAKLSSKKLENNIEGLKNKLGTINTEKLSNSIDTLKSKLLNMSTSTSNSLINVRNGLSSIGNRILRLASSAFVFNVISAGFREISKSMGDLIQADAPLNRSLQTIKFNLLTAFAPIYQYILPALRALAQALAVVTAKVATFVSMLFGTSLKQSQAMAGTMIETLEATNKYSKSLNKNSKSLNKVGKSAKKATKELASFDKIEVLKLKKDSKKSDALPITKNIISQTPNSGMTVPIKFDLNESESNRFKAIIDRLKAPLKDIDYGPLNESLKNLKITLSGYTKSAGEGLFWLYEEVLAPLGKWTMNKLVPAFLDLINASLEAFKPIWDQVGDDIKWLWNDFLKPAAKYTGNKLIEFLQYLTDKVKGFGESIKGNKSALEWFSATLIGLGTSLAIVSLIKFIDALTVKVIALTAALLANPWTWVVIGITAVIAVIIQVVRHWEDVKEAFISTVGIVKQVIDKIKTWISGLAEMIKGIFTFDWNKIAQGFSKQEWFAGGQFSKSYDNISGIRERERAIEMLKRRRIPRLAQGAVLEGGDPMLAYINDQPRGSKNIETPLNTMVEAFKSAMNNSTGGQNIVIEATGDMAGLISFLNLKLKKEEARIGSNMISGDVWV